MSLILKLFHLFVTSFKLSCFSYDTQNFSIKDFYASCEFSSHYLTNLKYMSIKLMIRKSNALEFSSYIFIFLLHFLIHLLLEPLTVLSGILGCPCVWKFYFLFLFYCSVIFCDFYLLCQVFQYALVYGDFLCPFLPLIKLIIITTEIDVPDGSSHILSFVLVL